MSKGNQISHQIPGIRVLILRLYTVTYTITYTHIFAAFLTRVLSVHSTYLININVNLLYVLLNIRTM